MPVVAAIDGVCIGGALEFAASCDLRIATDRARFGTPEVGIGLVATNAGTLLLPEVLGETAARELLLTGALRDVGWMREHGFLNEVVAPGEFADRIAHWAGAFDGVSRAAVARTKAMLVARHGELLDAGDGARGARLRRAVRRRRRPRRAARVHRALIRPGVRCACEWRSRRAEYVSGSLVLPPRG